MRVFLAYVFLVGLLLLFAAAGYGLWACADAAAHAAWYCRVLESIKPFTELISVILAFFGFLFGTIFSKNLAHEKEARALARALAAEISSIDRFLEARLKHLHKRAPSNDQAVLIERTLTELIHDKPIYSLSAHRIGCLPKFLADKANAFYWLLTYKGSLLRAHAKLEADLDRRVFEIELLEPRHQESWFALREAAVELKDLLSDFANTPLPPCWKLAWLR